MNNYDPGIPDCLRIFLAQGKDAFHCENGDWKVKLRPFGERLLRKIPLNSLIIAENGLGDVLFLLKSTGSPGYSRAVHVFWHEEQRSEIYSEDICKLTISTQEGPSRVGPIYYRDGKTDVCLGDIVTLRTFFTRRFAEISYVPGASPKDIEMEHHGLHWVGVRIENGDVISLIVDPQSFRLGRRIRFERRRAN
jgi:hypothetical protein